MSLPSTLLTVGTESAGLPIKETAGPGFRIEPKSLGSWKPAFEAAGARAEINRIQ